MNIIFRYKVAFFTMKKITKTVIFRTNHTIMKMLKLKTPCFN